MNIKKDVALMVKYHEEVGTDQFCKLVYENKDKRTRLLLLNVTLRLLWIATMVEINNYYEK